MQKSKQDNLADAYEAAIAAEIASYKAVFGVETLPVIAKAANGQRSKPAGADRNDPSTWRRPNLDNLKASIISDWKAAA